MPISQVLIDLKMYFSSVKDFGLKRKLSLQLSWQMPINNYSSHINKLTFYKYTHQPGVDRFKDVFFVGE
jgi:hypothetical protein